MTMTEKLDALEAKIKRLKQEYEQYFLHILKREPVMLKKEVQALILRYTNTPINNTADQFRLNCLLSRFNSYRQYWVRTLRAIDEGVYMRRAESGPLSPSIHAAPEAPSVPSEAGRSRPGGASPFERGAEKQRPRGGGEDLSTLYNEYIEAQRRHNTGVKGPSREKFEATIRKAREKIEKTYDVRDIDVRVIEKNGQVKLVIKPSDVKVG